ncbi:MAG TPA: 2'-5' RNA ligase family protein [Patescibacteria group bacterium]|nr:2'-5' RNA ligase family protein [Patescibacteria group bacterium]
MTPGDRLICLFIEDYLVGDTFTNWPLHITIVPWFRSEISDEIITKGLLKVTNNSSVLSLKVGEEKLFGSKKNKPVNIIESSQDLINIESRVRKIIKLNSSWIVDETTKQKRTFTPHITVQNSERLHEGDNIDLNKIFIVKQLGDYKEVVGKAELKNE